MEPLALDQAMRDHLWTRLGDIGEIVHAFAPELLAGAALSLTCAAVLSCCWGLWKTRAR